MTDDRSRRPVPLYLCCAEDNEVALIQVIDELHREGFAPELVSGLDSDPSILALAVDRAKDEGLFVFCLTAELDRMAVRRLEGLFSARRGPLQRSITVPLHAKHPLAILPAIRKTMSALSSGEAVQEAPEHARASTLCDVVGPVAFAPPWDPHPSRSGLARRLHRERMAEDERQARRTPHDAEVLPADPRPARATRVPVARGPIRTPRDVTPSDTLQLRNADVEVLLGDPDDFTPPQRPVSLGRPMPVIPVSTVQAHRGSRWAWVGAVAVLAGVGVVVAVAVAPPQDAAQDAASLAQAGITASAQGAFLAENRDPRTGSIEPRRGQTRQPKNTSAPARAEAPRTRRESAPQRNADAPGLAHEGAAAKRESPAGARGDTETAPQVRARRASEGHVLDREVTGPAAAVVDYQTPPASTIAKQRQTSRVTDALAHGGVRRIGGLLVMPPTPETLDWAGAREHCEAASPGALSGFRLPRTEQLRRLQSMLPEGNYWARDALDQPDEAVALDQQSGRTHVYLRIERAARAVCVRVE